MIANFRPVPANGSPNRHANYNTLIQVQSYRENSPSMCGRIFVLLLVAIVAFVAVTALAFIYLQWWQAILASATFLAVLFFGGKLLLRTAIVAWGEQLTKMTAGQAVVLRNASLQVHKVERTDPPRELTEDDDEFDDEDPDSRREREEELLGKTWYKIELTIFPNPDIEESTNPWSPHDIQFADFDSEPPRNLMTNFDEHEEDSWVPYKLKVLTDQTDDSEEEHSGPMRFLALVGLPNELRAVAIRYYTEQFGRIKLPGPLDDPKQLRER
jgi:hypothetical protein